MRLLKSLIAAVAVFMMLNVTVQAAPLAEIEASHSTLRIYSELDGLKPYNRQWLAVEITPRDGWHSYWKNPGDSGAAPILDWKQGSYAEAMIFSEPLFPTPKLIPVGPLANYGYDGASVLLVEMLTGDTSAAITLEAEWLICEVECVPQFGTLDFSLPRKDDASLGDEALLFSDARAKMPEPPYWGGLLSVEGTSSTLTVYADKADMPTLEKAAFFAGHEGVLNYATPQNWFWGEKGLVIELPRDAGAPTPKAADGLLFLTSMQGETTAYKLDPMLKIALENTRHTAATKTDTLLPTESMPVWRAALFALLGGLILNLMPCVFPILSLKAFSFISANYKTEAKRRFEGVAYTLGIWVSFMAIVAVLLALRAGGAAIGWGFQLQEPLFVALMVLLMTLVALSLSGMFDIRLGIEGAGQGFASREGAQGAFFKGVLAALVATPCTAPLMAPAIGFALTQPIITVFVVFSLLAVGMALPFLALAFIPAVARVMPKPGAWMEKMKEALAFPMYLTAAWLLYIFDRQLGAVATFLLLVGLVICIFGVWLAKQGQGRVLKAFALLVILGSIGFVASKPWASLLESGSEASEAELAYSGETLAALRAEGKPVFVYFTADWCITCKVNEKVVLMTDDIQQLFKDKGITVLKGDWTNRNAEIAGVLANYGRAGVPLYLYYAPGSKDAVLLPEILTPGAVHDAIS
ncbi:protein-disulfide reductase DsbD family protein [Kordiimonas sp.]|uniref:protein-disulfide reductase DsbD family protein n=1 Tax=Kordiimonas sp. TaxID=1970157 RepID=UPI003A8E11C9